jgi:hypothetical protein
MVFEKNQGWISFGMTGFFSALGEGSSCDSMHILSENQYSVESQLLPSPHFYLKIIVIPSESTCLIYTYLMAKGE